MAKKKTHGGARKGSGRKPKEQSVRIRVPLSKLEAVMKVINPPDLEQQLKAIRLVIAGVKALNNESDGNDRKGNK